MAKVRASLRAIGTEGSATALAAPIAAILLGAFLLLGAGFSPISIAHNAGHDSRHSFAFPCH